MNEQKTLRVVETKRSNLENTYSLFASPEQRREELAAFLSGGLT